MSIMLRKHSEWIALFENHLIDSYTSYTKCQWCFHIGPTLTTVIYSAQPESRKKFLDACQDTRSSNQYCEYEITDGNQRIHAKSKKVATLHKSY